MKSFSSPLGITRPKRAIATETHHIILIRVVRSEISTANYQSRNLNSLHRRRPRYTFEGFIAIIIVFEVGFPKDQRMGSHPRTRNETNQVLTTLLIQWNIQTKNLVDSFSVSRTRHTYV